MYKAGTRVRMVSMWVGITPPWAGAQGVLTEDWQGPTHGGVAVIDFGRKVPGLSYDTTPQRINSNAVEIDPPSTLNEQIERLLVISGLT